MVAQMGREHYTGYNQADYEGGVKCALRQLKTDAPTALLRRDLLQKIARLCPVPISIEQVQLTLQDLIAQVRADTERATAQKKPPAATFHEVIPISKHPGFKTAAQRCRTEPTSPLPYKPPRMEDAFLPGNGHAAAGNN